MLAKIIKWAVETGTTYIVSLVGEFTAQAFYEAYQNLKELDKLEKEIKSSKAS